MSENEMTTRTGLEVAIIGMSGRFPGAPDLETFWQNLCQGEEMVTFFSEAEMKAAGVGESTLRNPHYVGARAILEQIDLFDADFFGFSGLEAEIMDPQQRFFLECAWEALENAGYSNERSAYAIGVYAGSSMNTYLLYNISANPALIDRVGNFQLIISNDKDFLATRVSYKLNLEGPSLAIQTACSTSLVAVHLACQGLLSGECDMAMAGGVSILVPQRAGYLYQEGGIPSPDGHCRPFDVQAQGIVGGDGVGVVVLKRLEDALADGDTIHAIIKGSAINNDGGEKMGYTAPRIAGQAKVIHAAQVIADVAAESISYVEAHGTGTPLGDPIEVSALTQAFALPAGHEQSIAIGSVKSNVGHLDAAAGVVGLIKTVLALKHRELPPTLHYHEPNPAIPFANSPFYVNERLRRWENVPLPRRAGVSSFGIGGTNAHIILEEAPASPTPNAGQPPYLLLLSARSAAALERVARQLAEFLQQHPETNLADVAYTLQVGRRRFPYRRSYLVASTEEAVAALTQADYPPPHHETAQSRDLVFLFPGQGSQYIGMAQALYETEAVFRDSVDECASLLQPILGFDLREVLYPSAEAEAEAAERLLDTAITQPALFVVMVGLVRLWQSWGVKPTEMLGHSLGELVAAYLAGVFSLPDALRLVAERGRLMHEAPPGGMVAISAGEAEIEPHLQGSLTVAAINAPQLCVVAGEETEVSALCAKLEEAEIGCHRLHTRYAFHSSLLEEVWPRFETVVGSIERQVPQKTFISNVTGERVTPAQATEPGYWAKQMRQPVQFSAGIATVLAAGEPVLLEVGPGRGLSTLARQQAGTAVSTLPTATTDEDARTHMLAAAGKLWELGVVLDWDALQAGCLCRRIPLPTYPFERRSFWIHPQPHKQMTLNTPAANGSASSNLSASSYDRPEIAKQYVAPRYEIEEKIALLWQETLGLKQVGIYDNFLELGGHSLLAVQTAARLRETFNVEMTVKDLFECQTVNQLSTRVLQMQAASLGDETLAQLIDEVSGLEMADIESQLEHYEAQKQEVGERIHESIF